MSDLLGNDEDRFSCVMAHMLVDGDTSYSVFLGFLCFLSQVFHLENQNANGLLVKCQIVNTTLLLIRWQ